MSTSFFKNALLIFLIYLLFSCEDKTTFKDSIITCFDGKKNGDEKGIDCGGGCSEFCPIPNGLEGDIYLRTSLNPSKEYTITGPLIIRDGASLDIPAGMTIKVLPNKNAYIVVTQGAKIYAYGNAENPITITSAAENPQPGDWGGIILCGKAPINSGDKNRSEVGDIFYGGNEPNDSSGVLRYIKIEYTGATFRENTIFSGLSFFGVGALTTILNIQSLNSKGDNFKFFGGNVNANGLVGTNSFKTGITITEGWLGTLEKAYISGFKETGVKITENINLLPSKIKDITIIGNQNTDIIRYGEGRGLVNFENIYAKNGSLGINVLGSIAKSGIEANELNISNIEFENENTNFQKTNYTANNQSFYIEGINFGAGNSANLPDWTKGWLTAF